MFSLSSDIKGSLKFSILFLFIMLASVKNFSPREGIESGLFAILAEDLLLSLY